MDAALATVADRLARLDAEARAIPAAEALLARTVATWAERARRRTVAEHEAQDERERHARDVARRDEAWARFAEHADTHRFGLRDLDGQAEALRVFQSRLGALGHALTMLDARQEALETAEAVLDERVRAWRSTGAEVSGAQATLRQAEVRLATAEGRSAPTTASCSAAATSWTRRSPGSPSRSRCCPTG